MEIILMLILSMIAVLLLGCAAVAGYFFGVRSKENPVPPDLSEKQAAVLRRQQEELRNFWMYDGTDQTKRKE